MMGTKDKASNKAQDIEGKIKEKIGHAAGDEDLEREGKTDQVESALKGVGEKAKDAAAKIKDVVTDE